MKAHESEEDLSALLDGRLTAAEASRAREHLGACASCRAALDGLEAARSLLRRAPRRPLPADLASRILLEAAALEPRRRGLAAPWAAPSRGGRPWLPALALAAAFLAGLGAWMALRPAAASVPFEPLLAAHRRYAAGSLLAAANPSPSDLSEAVAPPDGEADN